MSIADALHTALPTADPLGSGVGGRSRLRHHRRHAPDLFHCLRCAWGLRFLSKALQLLN